jgi:hypothetical protein
MATALEHTPVVKGKDSLKFNEQLEKNQSKKASPEEKARIAKLVEKILKGSK